MRKNNISTNLEPNKTNFASDDPFAELNLRMENIIATSARTGVRNTSNVSCTQETKPTPTSPLQPPKKSSQPALVKEEESVGSKIWGSVFKPHSRIIPQKEAKKNLRRSNPKKPGAKKHPNPEEIKAFLEALENGDSTKALEITKGWYGESISKRTRAIVHAALRDENYALVQTTLDIFPKIYDPKYAHYLRELCLK